MIIALSVNVHGRHNVVRLFLSGPSIEVSLMSITFTKDKETKNTVRFTAPMGGEISGSIYVQKSSELAEQSEIVLEIAEKVEA